MAEATDRHEVFDTLARILLRCFVLGYCLLLVWSAMYLFASDLMYGIGSKWFDLSKHEVDLVNYCGLAAVKCAVLVFFLIPYGAIRLVLRKRTSPHKGS